MIIPFNKVKEQARAVSAEADFDDYRERGFIEGAVWAQMELKTIAIDFADWLLNEPTFEQFARYKKSTGELFGEFLKTKQ